ncbi:hypothetical protein [Spirillospora sp. CA-294931]|uniref:hypothetical protein n=1 Tax=Spirillospora sp. CA-294931 TaxID=3240042 RepID=UPI003D9343F8
MAKAMKSKQTAVAGGVSNAPAGGGQPAATLGRSGLGASGGQRLPVAQRERKPALAALAVLLILGGALASAYLVMASGQRVSAIRVAQPVAAGQRIPLTALEEVQIGDTGVAYIAWTNRAKVANAYASVPLVKGALLTNGMMSATDDAAKGRVVVGLALKPGQFPAKGLQSGKRVSLYAVGGGTGGGPRAGTVLSADAIVIGIGRSGDSGRLRGDQTTVDVAVPPGEAPLVTQAASAGTLAVAIIPDGTRVTGGPPPQQQTIPSETPGGTQNPGGGQTPGNQQPGGQTPGAGGN